MRQATSRVWQLRPRLKPAYLRGARACVDDRALDGDMFPGSGTVKPMAGLIA